MNLCVVGCGYVGLVTGACFADLGNKVTCVDNDKLKIGKLKRGGMPLYEPGLEDLIKRGTKEGRIKFTANLKDAVAGAEVIFIAVGTPPRDNGEADLSCVESVARTIAEAMHSYKLIVEKSTVPVNTGEMVRLTISHHIRKSVSFDVASNPEFLREGSAISDFMNPDRIVIGVESKRAERTLKELYGPLNSTIVVTDIKSAEIIKHASNSFLATKISFINAISKLCEKSGADVKKVAQGMGLDRRIGKDFLDAGIGFGGFCFPKDLAAFIKISDKLGYDFELLKAVERINEDQKRDFVKKMEDALWIVRGKQIGILGLSFKPNTDDMRFAPSVDIIKALQKEGARIKAFDPQATDKAKDILNGVKFCRDAYEVAQNSDALAVITEWSEFKELDLKRIKKMLKQPVIIDGRNIYDPDKMRDLGFRYYGVGRGKIKQ